MTAPLRTLALLLLAGCSGGGVEYALDLDVITPGNQSPFTGLDALKLTLEPERGEGESFDLSGTSGNPQLKNMGELVDTRIALEGYVGDELVSFGRTVSLSVFDGDQRVEPILMAEVDAFAWFGELDIARGMGAAASDGEGGFYIFGGASEISIGNGDSSNAILKINVAPPEAALEFEQIAALPEYTGASDGLTRSGRVGHSATLLTQGPNAGKVLIAGGSEEYIHAPSTTYDAALFDPATETFEVLAGAMASARANHTAVVNQQGDVLLFGGWGSGEGENNLVRRDNIERYDAEDNSFALISGAIPGEGIYGAGASIGTRGVLYCGGATLLGGTWEATDDCIIVSVSNEVSSAASMPMALAHASMAPIAGGEILLTGGLSVSASDGVELQRDPVNAETGAWIYSPDSDSWREAETPMGTARAYHRAVGLPDGRALVIGGASVGELFFSDAGAGGDGALACAELYTPGVGFERLNAGCGVGSATGDLPTQTQFPVVTVDATYGVMVSGGISGSLDGAAGTALWVANPGDR
ncbi:MAG: hypothetical protein H6740_23000 [Alphaproteobacteria bacterium]|nr:hypothetical protein [Alphaproteobacteria bacterium]